MALSCYKAVLGISNWVAPLHTDKENSHTKANEMD